MCHMQRQGFFECLFFPNAIDTLLRLFVVGNYQARLPVLGEEQHTTASIRLEVLVLILTEAVEFLTQPLLIDVFWPNAVTLKRSVQVASRLGGRPRISRYWLQALVQNQ